VSTVLRLIGELLRNVPVSLLVLGAERIAARFRTRSVALQADEAQVPPKRPPVDERM